MPALSSLTPETYSPLPTPVDPFLEMRLLGSDRRVLAVTRINGGVVGQHEQLRTDRLDDLRERVLVSPRVPRAPWEQRVAGYEMSPVEETDTTRGMARREQHLHLTFAERDRA